MDLTSPLPETTTMFDAFCNRDDSYDGLFVAAIRTTGIFCRPGCPARKPARENVEFFARASDAMAAGYRPCQRCRPLELKGTVPDWLQPLLNAVEEHPRRRWTVMEIQDFGLDPARVRRWFQTHYGMTFLAYQRARRLGLAFSNLRRGSTIVETAMDLDFDSVSGFCEALRRATGSTPGKAKNQFVLHVTQTATPLGPLLIAGDSAAVYLLEFGDRRLLQKQFQALGRKLGAVFFPGETDATRRMREELAGYFEGTVKRFATPVRFPGSAHQERVWRALLEVPYGETWTYGELATAVGRPGAARAVAGAVGRNRLSIVLPCHRIVGTDGRLTGYGAGLWRKRFLLALEGGRELAEV